MMIESLTPLWFIAFLVDVILGCMAFYFVMGRVIVKKFIGVGWFIGWWSFADAIALVLNATMGTDYFWSYHQTGIISDTAINIGLIYFLALSYKQNWALNAEDWLKINQIRKDAKIREMSK